MEPTQQNKYTQAQLDLVDFQPSKSYQWSLDTEFTLTGREFELLFNELMNFVNTPFGVQSAIKMLAIYNLMETKFKVAILEGKIKDLSKVQENPKRIEDIEFEEIKDTPQPVKETDLAVEG